MSQSQERCSSTSNQPMREAMQLFFRTLVFFVLLTSAARNANGARILCLVGTAPHNKPEWTQPLFKELIARGHELTLISTATDYDEQLIDNVEHIQLDNVHNVTSKQYTDLQTGAYREFWPIKHMLIWYESHLAMCRQVLGSVGFQQFLNVDGRSGKRYDLVIHDATYGLDCLLSLAQLQPKAPILALSSGRMTTVAFETARAFDTLNPALIPFFTSNYPLAMSYWQRLQNHATYLAEYFLRTYIIGPLLRNSMPKFPEVIDTHHGRIKMLLVNTHSSIDYVQNLPPNVLEVAGLHIEEPKVENLSRQVLQFAERFEDGLVFLSLPNSQLLNLEQVESIFRVIERFSSIGFLYRWSERHTLTNQPRNLLHVGAEVRQQDVLALPNLKAFVTHGNSFDLQEAVYSGVPMLALPLILDEFNSAQRIVEREIGIVLKATSFTEDELYAALTDLFNKKIYAKSAKQLQRNFRNRAKQPIDQAIWCVEQLLESPKAFDYLVPPKESNRNFFIRHSMDVLLLVFVGVTIFYFNAFYTIIQAVRSSKKASKDGKAKEKKSKSEDERRNKKEKRIKEKKDEKEEKQD